MAAVWLIAFDAAALAAWLAFLVWTFGAAVGFLSWAGLVAGILLAVAVRYHA